MHPQLHQQALVPFPGMLHDVAFVYRKDGHVANNPYWMCKQGRKLALPDLL